MGMGKGQSTGLTSTIALQDAWLCLIDTKADTGRGYGLKALQDRLLYGLREGRDRKRVRAKESEHPSQHCSLEISW